MFKNMPTSEKVYLNSFRNTDSENIIISKLHIAMKSQLNIDIGIYIPIYLPCKSRYKRTEYDKYRQIIIIFSNSFQNR